MLQPEIVTLLKSEHSRLIYFSEIVTLLDLHKNLQLSLLLLWSHIPQGHAPE